MLFERAPVHHQAAIGGAGHPGRRIEPRVAPPGRDGLQTEPGAIRGERRHLEGALGGHPGLVLRVAAHEPLRPGAEGEMDLPRNRREGKGKKSG